MKKASGAKNKKLNRMKEDANKIGWPLPSKDLSTKTCRSQYHENVFFMDPLLRPSLVGLPAVTGQGQARQPC